MSLIEQALRQTESEKTQDHCIQLSGLICPEENVFHLKTAQRAVFIILAALLVFLITALFIGKNISSHQANQFPSIKQTRTNKSSKNITVSKTISSTILRSKTNGSAVKNINSADNPNPYAKKQNRLFSDIPAQKEKKVSDSWQRPLTITSSSYLSVYSINSAGLLHLEKGDYRQARLFFEEALKYKPDNYKFLNNMGLSFYLDGKNHKAEFFFKKALKINPDNVDTLVNLGIVYRKIKQYEKSTDIFKKALSINQNSPELLYNYAILLEEINQQQKAVFYFYKFLETAPESLKTYTVDVKKHLRKIKLGLVKNR